MNRYSLGDRIWLALFLYPAGCLIASLPVLIIIIVTGRWSEILLLAPLLVLWPPFALGFLSGAFGPTPSRHR